MRKRNDTDVLPEIVETSGLYRDTDMSMSQNGYGKPCLAVQFTRMWLVLIIFLLMYGCAPTLIQMHPEELSHLKNQSDIQAVHYSPSPFSIRTPGKVMAGGGGILGSMFSLSLFESAGGKMAKEYTLEDPALRVQNRFLSSLKQDLGITNIRIVQESPSNDSIDELKRTVGKGMVFDFKTTAWTLLYYPFDWTHYRISYEARARLIRLENSRIAWQGNCEFIGEDPKTSPTMDELKANNGAVLKTMLSEAADTCAEELLSQFFGKERTEG